MTIELNDKDASVFLAFRQHQDNIEVMLNAGIFNMRRGSVEIHFDAEGKIGVITGHPLLYKRDTIVVLT